jgi:hypothetical protein
MEYPISEFGPVFFVTVLTILVGAIGMCCKYAFKSKCEDISCCDCIKVHRNVEAEHDEISSEENNI